MPITSPTFGRAIVAKVGNSTIELIETPLLEGINRGIAILGMIFVSKAIMECFEDPDTKGIMSNTLRVRILNIEKTYLSDQEVEAYIEHEVYKIKSQELERELKKKVSSRKGQTRKN